jgi:hypothetical protein
MIAVALLAPVVMLILLLALDRLERGAGHEAPITVDAPPPRPAAK